MASLVGARSYSYSRIEVTSQESAIVGRFDMKFEHALNLNGKLELYGGRQPLCIAGPSSSGRATFNDTLLHKPGQHTSSSM